MSDLDLKSLLPYVICLLFITPSLLKILKSTHKNSEIQKINHTATIKNPELTPHPVRSLTQEEKNILWKNATHYNLSPSKNGTSKNTELYISVGIFIYFVYLISEKVIAGAFDLDLLLRFGLVIFVLISLYYKRFEYYFDAHAPVFRTTGNVFIDKTGKMNAFYVREMEITPFLEKNDINFLDQTESTQMATIEYSPHSKFVWKIERFEEK